MTDSNITRHSSIHQPSATGGRKPSTLVWLSVHSSHSHRSLSLPLLHSVTEQAVENGMLPAWSWRSVEGTLRHCHFTLAATVTDGRPRVVAATMFLFNREILLKVLRRVKTVWPECTVILGGPECLSDNRHLLQTEANTVSAVLRGEGEAGLPVFLRLIDEPGQWHQVPGLCWLDDEGNYHDNGLAVLDQKDMDSLRLPTSSEFYDFSGPFVTLETARGCFSKCAYCTSAAGGPVRFVSLRKVRGMLRHLRSQAVREVRILDRTFNSDSRRCCNLLKCFAEEFPEMRFHIEVHPAFLDNAVKQSLSTFPGGRLHVEAGLQTSSEQGLRKSRRRGTPEQAWHGMEFLCNLANLEVHADVLAGLPEVSMKQTMLDLQHLIALAPAEIQLEVLKLLPGTEFRKRAAAYGLLYAPDPPYEVLSTPRISMEELRQIRQVSGLIDDFYNQPLLQPALRKAVNVGGIGFLFDLLEKLRDGEGNYLPRALTGRFRLFHQLLTGRSDFSPVREILEYQWLLAGHSAEHGIVSAHLWKRTVPEEAVLLEGDEQAVHRRGRIWQARIGSRDFWFVFPGGRRDRRAAAVYRGF